MRPYKTKSSVMGYAIGLENDNLYIAIPKKYFATGQEVVEVEYNGERKKFVVKEHEHEIPFKDKFKPENNYIIYYFKWKSYEN